MKRKFYMLLVAVIIAAVAVGYSLVYKPHRQIVNESADYLLTVSILKDAYVENDSTANLKFSDKTIIVTGIVTSIDTTSQTIVIDESLSAVLQNFAFENFKLQQKVTIKGRFVGYDDLLEEFKMDQTTLYNNK